MAECARCGAFTDNPAAGRYHYCDDCEETFDDIRESGVVVRQEDDGYEVFVPGSPGSDRGGYERRHVDALARTKSIADDLGLEALFEYDETGSRWVLESYLERHPAIRRDVRSRLRRAPVSDRTSLLGRIRGLFR